MSCNVRETGACTAQATPHALAVQARRPPASRVGQTAVPGAEETPDAGASSQPVPRWPLALVSRGTSSREVIRGKHQLPPGPPEEPPAGRAARPEPPSLLRETDRDSEWRARQKGNDLYTITRAEVLFSLKNTSRSQLPGSSLVSLGLPLPEPPACVWLAGRAGRPPQGAFTGHSWRLRLVHCPRRHKVKQ